MNGVCTCPKCGTFDPLDDDAWIAHCAHLGQTGGFDMDDFDDDATDESAVDNSGGIGADA